MQTFFCKKKILVHKKVALKIELLSIWVFRIMEKMSTYKSCGVSCWWQTSMNEIVGWSIVTWLFILQRRPILMQ